MGTSLLALAESIYYNFRCTASEGNCANYCLPQELVMLFRYWRDNVTDIQLQEALLNVR